jgi:hypothetical protein
MPTRKEIDEMLTERGLTLLLMDNFDEAFIGFSQRINEPELAVYDYELMVATLVNRDDMSPEEAEEYIEFNCIGAWVGEQTPIIVRGLGVLYA